MNIKKGDLSYLGKTIKAVVDRKIGDTHPKHNDLLYPINYGYVEGLVAGDGEEQDVYFLSEKEKKLNEFEGVVVAIIERENDNEDKWVAVSANDVGKPICYKCNIMHEINFQEQFYTSKCHVLFEKTCGAVLYNKTDNKYLLTESFKGHIGFPKGHVEFGENEHETALREVLEETGLSVELLDFRTEYTFTTLENSQKNSVFFAAFYDKTPVFQKEEVKNYWFLNYEEALEKLNWENDRTVLKQFHEFLLSKKTY